MAYKKCPRCCLNYIDEKESYCQICLAEMGKIKGDNTLDFTDDDYEICPECGENMISAGEEMCAQCAMLHSSLSHHKADDDSQSDAWEDDTYGEEIPMDDSKPEGIEMIDLEDLEEEEDDGDEEDEENRNDYDFDDEPILFDDDDEEDEEE